MSNKYFESEDFCLECGCHYSEGCPCDKDTELDQKKIKNKIDALEDL